MEHSIKAAILIFLVVAGRSLIQTWLKDYEDGKKLDRFRHF